MVSVNSGSEGYEFLMARNIELTARVEFLENSVKELGGLKEELLIENVQNTFKLSLAEQNLANCRNLLHAALNIIGCRDQAKKVMEELKTQLMDREEHIKVHQLANCLEVSDAHIQRILKLEKDIAGARDLRERLMASENELKLCKEKNTKLEKQLDEKCNKIRTLQSELQASVVREQDMENKTILLKKEITSMIQMSANDSRRNMEMENKVSETSHELAAAQQSLAHSEAKSKVLEQIYEMKESRIEILRISAERKEAINQLLLIVKEESLKRIEQRNHQLVASLKNRDDRIQKYETLVKLLKEEVERSRQETIHTNSTESMREEKENINTSEDEHQPTNIRRTRRHGENITSATAPVDISVIELSDSES